MTVFHRILSQNLRKARELLGWSRDKMAGQVGLSPNYLSEIEAGEKFPRPENLERICEVLRILPSDLFRTDTETAPFNRQDSHMLASALKNDFAKWVDAHLPDENQNNQAAEKP